MWSGDRDNTHGESDRLEHGVGDTLPVSPDNPAKSTEKTGVMVALFPDEEVAETVAVRGGTPSGDLHITLAYLGDISDDTPAGVSLGASRDRIVAAARIAAAAQAPLSGTIGGIGRFPHNGDGVPVWAPVDIPGLSALREALVEALDSQGVPARIDHGFTPHMTLGFNLDLALIPPVDDVAVTFGHLVVAVGGARTTVRLGGTSDTPAFRLGGTPDTPAQLVTANGYAPSAEVGADAGHRRPIPPEVTSYPRLAGTMEEQQENLRAALRTALIPERGGGDGRPVPLTCRVDVLGTYTDRVVCIVHGCSHVGADQRQAYEVPYSIDDDGQVRLGEPTEVELTVPATHSAGGSDQEMPVSDLLPLAETVEGVIYSFKALPAGEVPPGVLSAMSAARLRTAVEHLIHVLGAAGIRITGDRDDEQLPTLTVDAENHRTVGQMRRPGEGQRRR